jgi:hypothetical protein
MRFTFQHLLRSMIVTAALGLLCTIPALAVEKGEVAYVGGTLDLPSGTLGTFDLASPLVLGFRPGAKNSGTAAEVEISYTKINQYHYYSEVAHHIGVLPAAAVSLVRHRERKHFFSITYTDAESHSQVATFEIPKHEPATLLSIFRARAPQACNVVGPGPEVQGCQR